MARLSYTQWRLQTRRGTAILRAEGEAEREKVATLRPPTFLPLTVLLPGHVQRTGIPIWWALSMFKSLFRFDTKIPITRGS